MEHSRLPEELVAEPSKMSHPDHLNLSSAPKPQKRPLPSTLPPSSAGKINHFLKQLQELTRMDLSQQGGSQGSLRGAKKAERDFDLSHAWASAV